MNYFGDNVCDFQAFGLGAKALKKPNPFNNSSLVSPLIMLLWELVRFFISQGEPQPFIMNKVTGQKKSIVVLVAKLIHTRNFLSQRPSNFPCQCEG